jgi:hypothetical protein
VVEKIFAGFVLVVCGLLLLRLVIGARRRHAYDLFWKRLWIATRLHVLRLWHWPAARRQARRDADAAIRRASDGEWDGNVYKPKSFKRDPARDRKLH